MNRPLFSDEHEQYRAMVRRFVANEIVPVFPEWEATHLVPAEFFRKAGEVGIIGMSIPEEYGGGGDRSYTFSAILLEEVARALVSTGPLRCHMDIVVPYFLRYADERQRERWFPGLAAGE